MVEDNDLPQSAAKAAAPRQRPALAAISGGAAVVGVLTAWGTCAAELPSNGVKAPDAASWQAGFTERKATYEVEKKSLYITAPDGVRLAADIYLPKGLAPGARVPTLLAQTRYYRSMQRRSDPTSCSAVFPAFGYFIARGYAVVYVDVRGTGASFGTRKGELSGPEVKDGGAVMDWIVAQPWSSGAIGAFGQSYLGSSAELQILNDRKALKAVAPVSAVYDPYADL